MVSSAAPTRSPDDQPYLLYVGQRNGYKNFSRTVQAYAASARLRNDFDLIAFGGPPFTPAEVSLMEGLGLREGSVRHTRGSDTELAEAYRHARALLFTSSYEGFGIPPLEAMACGCPVVCSGKGSVAEVVASAGEYCDPEQADSMREATVRVCYDSIRRDELIRVGLERAKMFSWGRCADETLAVYERLLAA
jgi:glycosyltransferase involved in cell wall biosynthesis